MKPIGTSDGLDDDCFDSDDDGNAIGMLDGNELETPIGVPLGYPNGK